MLGVGIKWGEMITMSRGFRAVHVVWEFWVNLPIWLSFGRENLVICGRSREKGILRFLWVPRKELKILGSNSSFCSNLLMSDFGGKDIDA